MNNRSSAVVALLLIAAVLNCTARAQSPSPPGLPPPGPSQTAADRADTEDREESEDHDRVASGDGERRGHFGEHHGSGDTLFRVGEDSHLIQGQHADSVVSIFGSARSEGEAGDVVSIVGNTAVRGPVSQDAVSILGNTYVDSAVGGDVAAVLGNVELGPHADVGGDVSAVGGTVTRDAGARVHGSVDSVGGVGFGFGWLRPWIDHCLLYGRPLALVSGIGWAWSVAAILLALYVGLALLFRGAVSSCVRTVETQPGASLVAALLTMLLMPMVLVLFCITLIGIAAVPFILFGLFCISLFGKTVMLAWLGGRCLPSRAPETAVHPALAVLVGGVIVLALYVIPVLGFLVYPLLGLFGLGAVVYSLIASARAHRASSTAGAAAATPAAAAAVSAPAPAAAAASPTAPDAGASPSASASIGTAAGADAMPPGGAATAPAGAAAAGSATAAAPLVTAALPRAGFWIRMVALLLDALLVGVLLGALNHVFNMQLLVLAIYAAVMWKLRGSTIGGIVFDLQIVRLDGRPIDWETAIVRALSCFLSLAAAGLGFFWIAFDDGKQAWHDKIAGTAVVRVKKGVSLV